MQQVTHQVRLQRAGMPELLFQCPGHDHVRLKWSQGQGVASQGIWLGKSAICGLDCN